MFSTHTYGKIVKYICSRDYLKITNENATEFGKYCGQKNGETVVVTGKYALIKFDSDSDIEQKGFVLHFTPVPGGKSI